MRRASVSLFLTLLVAQLAIPGQPASPMETADWHVRQGKRLLAAGQFDLAIAEFDRAVELEKDHARAYALRAIGLIDTQQLDAAGRDARRARRLDGDDSLVQVCFARWAYESGRFETALRAFHKAKDLDRGFAPAWYYSGLALLELGRLEQASAEFDRVLQLGGPLVPEAAAARKHVAALLRGGPEGLHRLGPAEPITRAELAVLLIDEFSAGDDQRDLPFDNKPAPIVWVAPERFHLQESGSTTSSVPRDVLDHWAETVLREVLARQLRGLTPYPDGRFHPDLPATRAEFALVVEDVFRAYGGSFDATPRDFEDLPTDHFAHHAAMWALDLEALQPSRDGVFDPEAPVTGAEALLGLRLLRAELSGGKNR